MAKQRGRLAVLRVHDGSTWQTLAGCTTKQITVNKEPIDVATNPEPSATYSGGEIDVSSNSSRLHFSNTEITNANYNNIPTGTEVRLIGGRDIDAAVIYFLRRQSENNVTGSGDRWFTIHATYANAKGNSGALTFSRDQTGVQIQIQKPFMSENLEGKASVSISADATFLDEASETDLLDLAMMTEPTTYFNYVIPDYGYFGGQFHVDNLDFNGELEGAVGWSLQISSNGSINWVAGGV